MPFCFKNIPLAWGPLLPVLGAAGDQLGAYHTAGASLPVCEGHHTHYPQREIPTSPGHREFSFLVGRMSWWSLGKGRVGRQNTGHLVKFEFQSFFFSITLSHAVFGTSLT